MMNKKKIYKRKKHQMQFLIYFLLYTYVNVYQISELYFFEILADYITNGFYQCQ